MADEKNKKIARRVDGKWARWGNASDPSPLIRKLGADLFGSSILGGFGDGYMLLAVRKTCRTFAITSHSPTVVALIKHRLLSDYVSPRASISVPLRRKLMNRRLAVEHIFSPEAFVERREWLAAVLVLIEGMSVNASVQQLELYLKQQEPLFSLQQIHWLLADVFSTCAHLHVPHHQSGAPVLLERVTTLFCPWVVDPFSFEEPEMFEQVHATKLDKTSWRSLEEHDGCTVFGAMQKFARILDTQVNERAFPMQWLQMDGRMKLLLTENA
jgi:hypothetical protein